MVATFHLDYLGHRIKYGILEVGNTTQQSLSTTRPYCAIKFIESFLFWVIFVTYNIGIYILCIFIKLAIFILFLLCSTVMFFLHCMLNSLRYEKILCETNELIASKHDPSSDVIFLGVHSEYIFPVRNNSFFSGKLCFLWFSCLLHIAESISLDTSCKPTVGLFLKMSSPSWIILSI